MRITSEPFNKKIETIFLSYFYNYIISEDKDINNNDNEISISECKDNIAESKENEVLIKINKRFSEQPFNFFNSIENGNMIYQIYDLQN